MADSRCSVRPSRLWSIPISRRRFRSRLLINRKLKSRPTRCSPFGPPCAMTLVCDQSACWRCVNQTTRRSLKNNWEASVKPLNHPLSSPNQKDLALADLKPGDVLNYWVEVDDTRLPEPNRISSKDKDPRQIIIVSRLIQKNDNASSIRQRKKLKSSISRIRIRTHKRTAKSRSESSWERPASTS